MMIIHFNLLQESLLTRRSVKKNTSKDIHYLDSYSTFGQYGPFLF